VLLSEKTLPFGRQASTVARAAGSGAPDLFRANGSELSLLEQRGGGLVRGIEDRLAPLALMLQAPAFTVCGGEYTTSFRASARRVQSHSPWGDFGDAAPRAGTNERLPAEGQGKLTRLSVSHRGWDSLFRFG